VALVVAHQERVLRVAEQQIKVMLEELATWERPIMAVAVVAVVLVPLVQTAPREPLEMVGRAWLRLLLVRR
jgi:hypothetical protein